MSHLPGRPRSCIAPSPIAHRAHYRTSEAQRMTPASLHAFFAAAASVAPALIGLLFVAITVARESLTSPDQNQAHRVRASVALTTFTNALTVSLFALTRAGIGWPPFFAGLLGLASTLASLLSLLSVRQAQPEALQDALFLAGLVVTFSLQTLVRTPNNLGSDQFCPSHRRTCNRVLPDRGRTFVGAHRRTVNRPHHRNRHHRTDGPRPARRADRRRPRVKRAASHRKPRP